MCRKGYDDTSYTAKMQARYTDLIIFNKWELVDERRYDECLDRVGDMDVQVAVVKSDKGRVDKDLLLGLDSALAKQVGASPHEFLATQSPSHSHAHQSEVEVISVTLRSPEIPDASIDIEKLERFLASAPKDEIYRIKAIVQTNREPKSSDGSADHTVNQSDGSRYILNWAFGRWTFTRFNDSGESQQTVSLRMTIICARYEANKCMNRINSEDVLGLHGSEKKAELQVKRIL